MIIAVWYVSFYSILFLSSVFSRVFVSMRLQVGLAKTTHLALKYSRGTFWRIFFFLICFKEKQMQLSRRIYWSPHGLSHRYHLVLLFPGLAEAFFKRELTSMFVRSRHAHVHMCDECTWQLMHVHKRQTELVHLMKKAFLLPATVCQKTPQGWFEIGWEFSVQRKFVSLAP